MEARAGSSHTAQPASPAASAAGDAGASYRLEDITKVFPGVRAVDGVDLEVRRGEIHGVIGKNGAGKSVLMSVIAGVLAPTRGTMLIGGERIEGRGYTPARAHALGVALIPQEPLFAPSLSVTDNLFLGTPLRRLRLALDHGEMERRVHAIAERLGVEVRPSARMSTLPIEDQQLLAFGKALFIENAKVVLLDEITASLTQARKRQLLEFLREALRDDPQRSFTLISHHIGEVLEFCDRVTVLRDGRVVATVDAASSSRDELAQLIVGDAPTQVAASAGERARADGPPVLRVEGLQAPPALARLDLEVRAGEVVGLAGLDGSGKEELLLALCGLNPTREGTVSVDGSPRRVSSPAQALRNGIAYLPKKREELATIHNRSVEDNILAPIYPRLRGKTGLLDRRRARAVAEQRLAALPVKTPSLATNVDHLSGGNRQKVMLNRLAAAQPRVFLLNEPTRGVDVATKPEILRIVRDELAPGRAVVLTCESEEEMVEACDRVIVLYRGQVRRELVRGEPGFSAAEIYKHVQGVGAE